jgi:hypothetical protein
VGVKEELEKLEKLEVKEIKNLGKHVQTENNKFLKITYKNFLRNKSEKV